MLDEEMIRRASAVLEAARARRITLVTAESCTGGLLAAALTAVAGASDVVDGGFVTYSNEAKARLGVPVATLSRHGAVSEAVARALAEAARARSLTEATPVAAGRLAVAVTGVAGPGGGSAAKPVGLVHFATAGTRGTRHVAHRFADSGRATIRRHSVLAALDLLAETIAEMAAPDPSATL